MGASQTKLITLKQARFNEQEVGRGSSATSRRIHYHDEVPGETRDRVQGHHAFNNEGDKHIYGESI